ncbi:MAG: Hsp20/alpha crystallin family protein [Ilumatobacteraceae bacterium]
MATHVVAHHPSDRYDKEHTMILQNSPFRELDNYLNQRYSDARSAAFTTRPMPMDAYRRGDNVWVHLDLPGVTADSIDISVERNVLTVAAERGTPRQEGDRMYFDERHDGTFRRQVTLGEGLDADGIEADYTDGVLSVRIPVAPQAQPRKINVGTGQHAVEAGATDAD